MPRRNYYMPRVVASSAPAPAVAEQADIVPVVGRVAIAAELKITVDQLDNMIYIDPRRAATSGERPPIHKVRGIGLVADRALLLDWWRRVLRGETAA
jgi:hypothetical protein